ncbi:uncharacterized protein STEHIDRAFT_108187 [Stereum hirsutum FP-91666 SS1]|uniref:uncharacterized protein n=1 Tax=Stereum hirsutum (strain FP-91666) TaxID=721885 RepID=UPI000440F633|nr:uncharacterized protein STEHIDRAFT_108187 [Stereum hirsutum FP-91666 SS1]EIM89451.1 hypothetical protein STEHIDRAFT_108187 [Stereum hirsutum FP-91666 SS1]
MTPKYSPYPASRPNYDPLSAPSGFQSTHGLPPPTPSFGRPRAVTARKTNSTKYSVSSGAFNSQTPDSRDTQSVSHNTPRIGTATEEDVVDLTVESVEVRSTKLRSKHVAEASLTKQAGAQIPDPMRMVPLPFPLSPPRSIRRPAQLAEVPPPLEAPQFTKPRGVQDIRRDIKRAQRWMDDLVDELQETYDEMAKI